MAKNGEWFQIKNFNWEDFYFIICELLQLRRPQNEVALLVKFTKHLKKN